MITLLIILAEISFWIFIVAGLFARYVWKREKLSWYFFAMVPMIDLTSLRKKSPISKREGTEPPVKVGDEFRLGVA